MIKRNFILTGSSGYIGSNFVNKHPNTYCLKRSSDNRIIITKDNSIVESIFGPSTLIHLATHFSLDRESDELINNVNIDYGKKVIKFLENVDIQKIIYTNSMYRFYKGKKERESTYTKTKNIFSKYLMSTCKKNNLLYEEIYLDNTYGGLDKRNKIIPIIMKSIHLENSNPIKNPANKINLMYVDDIIERLAKSASDNKNKSSLFIDTKSVSLISIYDFLLNYKKNKIIEEDILKFYDNDYNNTPFEINYENINIKDISNGLVETYLDYEN